MVIPFPSKILKQYLNDTSPGEELINKAFEESRLNIIHGIEDEPNDFKEALILYVKDLEQAYRSSNGNGVS